MSNPGFISTDKPEQALAVIKGFGYEAKVVGQLQEAVDGKTGVQLKGIKTKELEDVYFPGKAA